MGFGVFYMSSYDRKKEIVSFAWFRGFYFYLDNDVFIGNDVGYELRKPLGVEYTVGVCLFMGGEQDVTEKKYIEINKFEIIKKNKT